MLSLTLLLRFQGSARRKKKVVHRTATADDKKLQSSLKKLAVNNIAGIEEVNWYGSTAQGNSECSHTPFGTCM